MLVTTAIDIDATLRTLRDELSGSVRNLDLRQTQLRPPGRPNAWSIQQIVEHLLLTYDGTSQILEERLAKGTATKKQPTPMQRGLQFMISGLGYFPRGRMAPEAVRPRANQLPANGLDLANAVALKIDSLHVLTAHCEQKLGNGRCVTHFILGPMSMVQWRRFHLAHGRHHIKQILAIRRQQEPRPIA